MIAFCYCSGSMCQDTDSVKVSMGEVRESVRLFMDRDRLLKENELLWKAVLAQEQRFSRALYYDSVRIQKLVITDERYKKEKKKSERRMKWIFGLAGLDGAFILLFLLK